MKLQKNNGNKEVWQLPGEAVLRVFRGSDEWGEFLAGTPIERALRKFIASPNGLASSFEETEFEKLMKMVKEGE